MSSAFDLAQELRTDPFAIKRRTEETPEVAQGIFKDKQLPRNMLQARMIIGHGQYGKVRGGNEVDNAFPTFSLTTLARNVATVRSRCTSQSTSKTRVF